MTRCVYCNKEKNKDEFSQEHVIPRSIGGNLSSQNPFLLNNVCKRCNTISGVYIDGPFIKSWLIHNYRSEALFKYTDITRNPVLPLKYIGPFNGINFKDYICELWLGPTYDTIYHFHKSYPEEPFVSPMVGLPSYSGKYEIDPGFAFLFVRSNNPAWHPTIRLSFAEQFKGSVLFLGNGPNPKDGLFSDIPPELHDLHLKLKGLSGKMHKGSIEMGVDYGDRFLAKVALGLGTIMLKPSFINSDSAQLLRAFMWTKDRNERKKIPLGSTGFLGELNDNFKRFMSWPSGHIIALITTGNLLSLYVSFYEHQCAIIQVSAEPEHWNGIITQSIVFVIIPGLQRYVGPKNMASYIGHKIEPSIKDPDLCNLENEMSNVIELPPYDI
jgi:hypothetical protein